MKRPALAAVCGLLICFSSAFSEGTKPGVTRADLALALQRFEKSFLEHRPERERLVQANLAFEDVTQNFFRMNFSVAIGQLNKAALELSLGRQPTEQELWLASLKVVVDPPVVGPNSAAPVIHLWEMVPVAESVRYPFELVLVQGGKEKRIPVTPNGEKGTEVAAVPITGDWAGTWNIHVAYPKGLEFDSGRRLIVVPFDVDERREENVKRLARIADEPGDLASARSTCRARNELLKSKPSDASSTEFLSDPNVLAAEIEEEIKSLESGKNPYFHRTGDYWRVMTRGSSKIPMRVYVPKTLDLDQPVPLVVALHGAGGDENMFMDAYGLGKVKREADRKGFIVVSPATFYLLTRSGNLSALVEEINACYPIDSKRVYVLGHSMGGGATAKLASEKSDLITAASCIAGFRGFNTKTICPTLILSAELDAIVPKNAIEEGAKQAIKDGLPVEYKSIASYGHTMVVEAELPGVIDWLFKHVRGQ